MDEAARKVLRFMKTFILKNLILNDEILNFLENKGILTESMVQTIKAQATDNDKIVKLLYILTRRGPSAFRVFVDAIRADFDFVSEALEDEYAKELSEQDDHSDTSTETSSQEVHSRRSSNVSITMEGTETTSALCRRCSQTITSQPILEDYHKATETSDFMQRMMQESFQCWYTKLKSHMTNLNLRELSFLSPVPVTFDMVDQLLDELINIVDGCYKVLGKKKDLVTHVIQLKESKKKMKQELKEKEDQRNKYADNIIKLENRCRDLCEQIDVMKRDIQKVHAEKMNLEKKIEETMREKDKEIEQLRHQLANALKQHEENNTQIEEDKAEIKKLKATRCENRRSRSKEYYHERRHVNSFIHKQRNKDHSIQTDTSLGLSVMSKQVKEVQHNNSKENEDNITAVEEPDGYKLKRANTFAETTYKTSKSPVRKTYGEKLQSSDKENHEDFEDKTKGQSTNKEIDDNVKPQQQSLMISSSSYMPGNNAESTDFNQSRRSPSRRNSIITRPRKKTPAGSQQTQIGIFTNNQQTSTRNVRHAPNETPRALDNFVVGNNQRPVRNTTIEPSPRVLDTFVICNNLNNKQTTQNESPRAPKAMRRY